MREDRHTNPINEILASIKSAVSEAYQAFERGDAAAWRIQGAFVRMRVLLEAAGLPEAVHGELLNWAKITMPHATVPLRFVPRLPAAV